MRMTPSYVSMTGGAVCIDDLHRLLTGNHVGSTRALRVRRRPELVSIAITPRELI